MNVVLSLIALLLAGWGVTEHMQAKVLREKNQMLVDQLEDRKDEQELAFAENRRLAMAQAGAVSDLEDAQARIRTLESELEEAKEELTKAPTSHKQPGANGWDGIIRRSNLGGLKHIEELKKEMQIKLNGNVVLGGGADKKSELEDLKTLFAGKGVPLSEEQETSMKKLLHNHPVEAQTITQSEDGNAFTIVMTQIGGTDEERDEQIREGAEKILGEKQQKLLHSWQKKRGKRKFHSTQSFEIHTEQ
jgi:ribosomal protein L12E/L44/L45/RPP1/RPP2